MAGQVDARQDIERAETNLKEWTKQFNQQMNYLKEMLTKEVRTVSGGGSIVATVLLNLPCYPCSQGGTVGVL